MQELQETQVRSLGLEDPLKEGMATNSSILVGESTDRGTWWVTWQIFIQLHHVLFQVMGIEG